MEEFTLRQEPSFRNGEEKGGNVILIGMPGVGKSTVGVVLAKEIGYEFLDSDLLLQKREGLLLHEIIERDGIDGFLRAEEEVCCGISVRRTVIATGGSVVYGREAMEHLAGIGTVVYLRLSYEPLAARLRDLKGRGVVTREGQTLRSLYDERTPLYEKYADVTIDEDGRNIEETLAAARAAIRKNAGTWVRPMRPLTPSGDPEERRRADPSHEASSAAGD